MNELKHFGVKGMKWGVRKKQKAAERAERKDVKWVAKGKGSKITEKARKKSSKEAEAYARTALGNRTYTSKGQISKSFMNVYNQKLAALMNERIGDIPAPSGKLLRFVAKRGELGVHSALADAGYNMQQVARGVNATGRIAYRKTKVSTTSSK